MEKVFLLSILITFLFCVTKFIEMKYLDKDVKPLKFMVRDGIIVMMCSIVVGYFTFHMDNTITDFFNIITETKTLNTAATQVFTGEPEF
jgi:hypothetical protein